jgi:erythromycin esterase
MIKSIANAWLAIMALMLAGAAPAMCADDDAATRQALETQYARLGKAALAGDIAELRRLTETQVNFVLASGDELDLGKWANIFALSSGGLETPTLKYELQSLVIVGEEVRTVVHGAFEAVLRQEASGVKYRVLDTVHDIWIKAGSEWRLRRSTTIHTQSWFGDTMVQESIAKPPPEPAQRDAIVAELRARAIPIASLAPGTGHEDLAALDDIIGDARIVALGEATHGTAEFFRMKHRLIEYLVERKGFTVIAFEAHWPVSEIADRYVKAGQGTAATALKELGFWVWRTQEVRDLIDWMHAYNHAPGRKQMLSFSSFDMQETKAATRCVIEVFDRIGGADAETIRQYYHGTDELYSLMDPVGLDPGARISDDEKARLRANVAEALNLVDARSEALLKTISAADYRRVRQCAAIVQQASLPGASTEIEIVNSRDKAMADNVRWLLDEAFPNEKIILWAHNGHVAAISQTPGLTPLGEHLRDLYGDSMRVIGFGFDRGQVRSKPLRGGKFVSATPIAIELPAAKPNSAEAMLGAAGLPGFLLDLRAIPASGPLGSWLGEPQPFRSVGGAYDADMPWSAYGMIELTKAFDVLVFIEESSPSVPLE